MPSFEQVSLEVIDELNVQRKTQRWNIPGIMGGVGGGKSSMARMAAVHFMVGYEPINCGDNGDPTEIVGTQIPEVFLQMYRQMRGAREEHDDTHVVRVVWALNRAAALACREPTLLLFDDIDKAPPMVQNGLIGLFGERKFRDHVLHPDSLLMCAGNRTTDDIYAHNLSESLRTRITIIELETTYRDLAQYAHQTGRIHEVILGFLASRPELVHHHEQEAWRFPCPRAWEEVSAHFAEFEEPKWRRALERKVGTPAANDFMVWWEVLKHIDVESLLTEGKSPAEPEEEKDRNTYLYACIFVLCRYLNQNKVRTRMEGIPKFIERLRPEMRMALASQLSTSKRNELAKTFPAAANHILEILMGV